MRKANCSSDRNSSFRAHACIPHFRMQFLSHLELAGTLKRLSHRMLLTRERRAFANIREWWRNWRAHRYNLAELHDATVLELLASDLEVTPHDLCAVTAKWPDGSELLNERMAALRLNSKQFSRAKLGALRDAQRVCTMREGRNHSGDPVACHRPGSADPADAKRVDFRRINGHPQPPHCSPAPPR